jgi:hypothetical protein
MKGMPLRDLYSTILAGRPGLNRADSGGTVNEHVARMMGAHRARALLFLKSDSSPQRANPLAHWDPNFDQKLKIFKDARPLGSDRHSMNEIHDYRSVANDVNIHVASVPMVDMTARPLSRPRNADLIRNTTSYAS